MNFSLIRLPYRSLQIAIMTSLHRQIEYREQ
jgi:hypothetical protein